MVKKDKRLKPVTRRSTTATPNRGAPDFLKRDLLGMKQQLVKGVPNNYLYIGGGLIAVVGATLVASDMGLVDLSFLGIGDAGLMANATATPQPQVKTGEPVKIVGDIYNKQGQPVKVPAVYVAIYEDNGQQQFNQQVASNASHFEIAVPTANFRDGVYSFVVDSKPIVAKPQGVTQVGQYNPYDISVSPGATIPNPATQTVTIT